MKCECTSRYTCLLCLERAAARSAQRVIKTGPDYCSCGNCEKCHSLADQVYELQHPTRICTGCGSDENHSHATSCQTCLARYTRIITGFIGQEVTLWSHDGQVMIYGALHYHIPQNYNHLPEYLRPLCVDKPGYAYIQFKTTQIVNVHTYTNVSDTRSIQITVKL